MASCTDLDRVAPGRRPTGRAAGQQTWENLLFVHFTFPAPVVRALVPAELELDLWEGEAWVGIVPFEMKDIRPAFVPIGLDFLETNLRTYVHRRGEPGVFFFSLEASSLLAVEAARFGWGLPYFHADMATITCGPGRTRTTTDRRGVSPGVRSTFDYSVGPALGASAVGTLEHFLLERYYLFTVREGRVSKGQVHHVPYPAHAATLHAFHDDLMQAAGLPGPSGPPGSRQPASVHFSPGVEVEVFGPWEEPAVAG